MPLCVPCGENSTRHMIEHDSLIIRPENSTDINTIFLVNSLAFETETEAVLVNRLREKNILFLSLISEYRQEIIGHILFTRVHVNHNPRHIKTIGLAPMALIPEYQRQNVGTRLIQHGLEFCIQKKQEVIFVLGHADYYPRIGFQPVRPYGLFYQNGSYDPYFFVHELKKNTLRKLKGNVFFDPEFDQIMKMKFSQKIKGKPSTAKTPT